jgi:hypothetical protein
MAARRTYLLGGTAPGLALRARPEAGQGAPACAYDWECAG